jgi:hypothetical protein
VFSSIWGMLIVRWAALEFASFEEWNPDPEIAVRGFLLWGFVRWRLTDCLRVVLSPFPEFCVVSCGVLRIVRVASGAEAVRTHR